MRRVIAPWRWVALVIGIANVAVSAVHAAPTTWMTLAPGLEYTKRAVSESTGGGMLHAFRLDPARYRLDLALAQDYGLTSASVRELGERARAILAINGGFFSPEHRPLGLRIRNGRERSPLKGTSWWGVFFIRNGTAQIVAPRDYRPDPKITMAVQVGPRLVVDGQIPPLKPGEADRSALGITAHGKVVIIVTEAAPLETTALAEWLRTPESRGGLGCRAALNLDGGHSAQLFARLGRFQLHVPNLSPVTDAVIVLAR